MANLEIIDMLCEINTRLSDLVRRMATEMEQANILLLGVGNALEMAEKRHLDEHIRKQLEEDQAVAEACGYYFDGKGKVV